MLNQIAVVVKNQPGSLRNITKLLSDHQINCLCVSTYDAPDFGVLRMIVDDFETGCRVLEENGETECVLMEKGFPVIHSVKEL